MAAPTSVPKQLAFPFAIQYLKPEFERDEESGFFAPMTRFRTPFPQRTAERQAA